MIRLLTTTVTTLALLLVASAASAGGRPLSADLDAADEVGAAAPGDPGTTGTADLTLNSGLEEVCVTIEVSGNDTPILAAHIHEGGPGVNGPIVVDFQVATNGLQGCVDADRDLVKDIRRNPGSYYVNVHNAVSPAGAARGQLTR